MLLRNNLLGLKFGNLHVIGRDTIKKQHGKYPYICICDCGKKTKVAGGSLSSGNTKSCGCLKMKNEQNKTHGLSTSNIYNIRLNVRNRCNNKKSKRFKDWGGRGIKCLRKSFEEFYEDMGPTYKEGLTIDRINNEGNYCKENCRWATRKEQSNNTRRNIYLIYKGEKKTLAQWSKKTGKNYWSMLHKYRKGCNIEEILFTSK